MYPCAQITAGFEHMLRRCWQTVRREETMKRSAPRGRKLSELPIAWREAKYPALRANAADTYDDRVSENILDVDDERAEVENIIHRMIHGAN
jgi:hypothetical protein